MAWQPLTFQGVADFARASWARTNLILLLASALVSGLLVWAVDISFIPDIEKAIAQLPEEGGIDQGILKWPRPLPESLTEGPFVTIRITDGSAPGRLTTDWQIELRPAMFHGCWFLGCADFPYSPTRSVPLNKAAVEPWWGAWKPAVLWGTGLVMLLFFLVLAGTVSFICLWPARLLAFFLDRQVTLDGTWRLTAAAAIPGLSLVALAGISYAARTIGLVPALTVVPLYLIVSAVYVAGGLIRLPRLNPTAANPFKAPEE